MKDLETIFRENRIVCNDMILCPLDDWNAIASQANDLEAINVEMYAMLEILEGRMEGSAGDYGYNSELHKDLISLLTRARGES